MGKSDIFGLDVGDFAHIQASGMILLHPKLLCFVFYVLCLPQKIQVLLSLTAQPPPTTTAGRNSHPPLSSESLSDPLPRDGWAAVLLLLCLGSQ